MFDKIKEIISFFTDFRQKVMWIIEACAWLLDSPLIRFKINTTQLSEADQKRLKECVNRLTDGDITDKDAAFLLRTISKFI